MASASKINDALDRIKELAADADSIGRKQLMSALHKIAYSMETPDDTLHRYGAMHLQTAAVKIGLDIALFEVLSECDASMTISELCQKTSTDAFLLGRILRYLAAIGAVDEVAADKYAPNQLTNNLATKVAMAGVNHYFATVAPQYQALPAFLKRTNYINPTDEFHTVFQDAWGTSQHQFDWLANHPENLDYFNSFMALRRHTELSWLTVYPVEKEIEGCSPERPTYVNIGGGIGHQCAQFKEKYPDLPGRVILQDLPHTIAKALETPGVENMAHDFFDPQPVRGAKFYFMRGVFHNHPPHKVRRLLEHTKSAMSSDSILLIDEWVLPDTDIHIDAASMDLTMMTAFAGMERSEQDWRDIIKNSGLTLVKTYSYNQLNHESVMDVRLM